MPKRKKSLTQVNSLKDAEGNFCTTSKHITQAMATYYKKLYSSSDPSPLEIKNFPSSTKLYKRLSSDHKTFMDAPIMSQEITDVIKTLKPNKSPGPDRHSIEFYKHFMTLIVPMLKKTFNSIMTNGILPET